MTIVVTGGGSGGHITPILAVAHELKLLQPSCRIVYIGQTGDGLADIPAGDPAIDEVYTVQAGKLRRYHGEGWRQLLDLKTLALNVRDAFRVVWGLGQSYRLLKRLQPDVLFVKGGFVGVPVGLAAAKLGIPYVTHDSDAIPGLANRIIGKWAALHTVALPADLYNYPAAKTISVGIPLVADFQPVTEATQRKYKHDLNLTDNVKLLFVIGGGLGAQRINAAMTDIAPHLLSEHPNLHIMHGVGRANQASVNTTYDAALAPALRQRLHVMGFITDLYRYSGAADVIVTRAGATNLAEFSVQGKACVVVPSPFLTGGHQLKNAQVLADAGAVVVVDEADMQADANYLARAVSELLKDTARANRLGAKFQTLAHRDSASQLALLLLKQVQS